MIKFVIAKLLENEIGAMYQESVFDRWLTVELPSGKLVRIFDLYLISEDLIIGESYEFVLCPLTFDVKNARKRDTFTIYKIIPVSHHPSSPANPA